MTLTEFATRCLPKNLELCDIIDLNIFCNKHDGEITRISIEYVPNSRKNITEKVEVLGRLHM